MMGRKSGENKLFYLFNLDDKVPQDHFLRQVAKVVDFKFIYDLTRSFYSFTGSPSSVLTCPFSFRQALCLLGRNLSGQ